MKVKLDKHLNLAQVKDQGTILYSSGVVHRIRSIQNDQQAIRDSSGDFRCAILALPDILSQSSVGAFSSRCRLREVKYRLRSMYKAKKDGKIFEFV